jgi:hypothetical protein
MSAAEFVGRLAAVGIFIIENVSHIMNFHLEVETLVSPATSPLPSWFAVGLHAITVALGLSGSLMFLGNFFWRETARERLGAAILCIFMLLITWSWWLRRFGVFVWDVSDPNEKRQRTIHCLKNISILGFLVLQSISSSKSRNKLHKL